MFPLKPRGENSSLPFQLLVFARDPWYSLAWRHITPVSASIRTWLSSLSSFCACPSAQICLVSWGQQSCWVRPPLTTSCSLDYTAKTLSLNMVTFTANRGSDCNLAFFTDTIQPVALWLGGESLLFTPHNIIKGLYQLLYSYCLIKISHVCFEICYSFTWNNLLF